MVHVLFYENTFHNRVCARRWDRSWHLDVVSLITWWINIVLRVKTLLFLRGSRLIVLVCGAYYISSYLLVLFYIFYHRMIIITFIAALLCSIYLINLPGLFHPSQWLQILSLVTASVSFCRSLSSKARQCFILYICLTPHRHKSFPQITSSLLKGFTRLFRITSLLLLQLSVVWGTIYKIYKNRPVRPSVARAEQVRAQEGSPFAY